MSPDVEQLAEQFANASPIFTASPLYQALCPVVAEDRPLLELLTERRSGQQAPYLFFAAVHDLLLRGAPHPLREFYPSVVGDAARAPTDAGPVLIDFCRQHHDALATLVRTRLVQSNVVRRVIGLRFALWAIGKSCRQAVHLVEVGASAGLLLNVDRYRYLIGDQVFGRPDATVTVDTQWLDTRPPPDLNDVPAIASRVGVDLNPVAAADVEGHRWLRALVWPEERTAAALLVAALAEARTDPPTVIAGDAVDVCPKIGRELPAGEPRVVFHAATRMHVPAERRVAFDNAIDSIGQDGPLYHVWLEPADAWHHPYPADDRAVVAMHGPDDGVPSSLVRVGGHLDWMEPLE